MASGQAHSTVAMLAIAAGTTIAVVKQWPADRVLVGLVCGWAMTPDLDVDHETIEEYRLSRLPIIGFAVATLWQMLWLPYARAIRHRDPLSHCPVIGTAGRIAYLLLWLLLISWMIGACGGALTIDWRGLWAWLWPWAFVAWAVQDVGHWCWDNIPILKEM